MTGTQVFQFDVNAIIQMILWGLVLVAVASAFVNLGGGKKMDTRAPPSGQTPTGVKRRIEAARIKHRRLLRPEYPEGSPARRGLWASRL